MQTGSEIGVPLTGRDAPPIVREVKGGHSLFLWFGFAAALVSGAILFWFNPATNGFYPRCFFHMITGWDCPGCGGLRATHQLLHGHFREAFLLNPLLVIVLPIAALFGGRWVLGRLIGKKFSQPFSNVWIWIAAAVVVGFGVLRNLPWQAWLASIG